MAVCAYCVFCRGTVRRQSGVSPVVDDAIVTRRTRQHAELRHLCSEGQVARAIDLAFEHFADFGSDEELVAVLAAALDGSAASPVLRVRFEELTDVSRTTQPSNH